MQKTQTVVTVEISPAQKGLLEALSPDEITYYLRGILAGCDVAADEAPATVKALSNLGLHLLPLLEPVRAQPEGTRRYDEVS